MSRSDLDRQLEALRADISTLATLVDELLDRAMSSVDTGDAFDARMAQSREDELDRSSESIEEKTIDLLTLQQPIFAADLRLLVASLTVGQRLQRIGHGALGVSRLAVDLAGLPTHEPPPRELITLAQQSRTMLRTAIASFIAADPIAAGQVVEQDHTVDSGYRSFRDSILQALGGVSNPDENAHRRLTFWLWIAHKLERVADHSVTIARRTQQMR